MKCEIKHTLDRDGQLMCDMGYYDAPGCNFVHKEYTHGGTMDDCYLKCAIWEPRNCHDHGSKYSEMCPGPKCPGADEYDLKHGKPELTASGAKVESRPCGEPEDKSDDQSDHRQ